MSSSCGLMKCDNADILKCIFNDPLSKYIAGCNAERLTRDQLDFLGCPQEVEPLINKVLSAYYTLRQDGTLVFVNGRKIENPSIPQRVVTTEWAQVGATLTDTIPLGGKSDKCIEKGTSKYAVRYDPTAKFEPLPVFFIYRKEAVVTVRIQDGMWSLRYAWLFPYKSAIGVRSRVCQFSDPVTVQAPALTPGLCSFANRHIQLLLGISNCDNNYQTYSEISLFDFFRSHEKILLSTMEGTCNDNVAQISFDDACEDLRICDDDLFESYTSRWLDAINIIRQRDTDGDTSLK